MKKLLLSTLIASGLAITGAGSFALEEQPKDAQTEQDMQEGTEQGAIEEGATEIRGEVTSVQDSTIEIKDEAGETHSFDTTGLQNEEDLKAEALKPGDMVRVEMADGKPTLIEKVEATGDASSEAASEDVAKEDAESMKEDASTESEASGETAAESKTEVPAEEELGETLEGEEQAEVGEGEYIVQEGDTLAEIAEQHFGSQEDWQIIAKANNLDNPDSLFIGQRLIIPSKAESGSQDLEQQEAPAEPMEDNPESAPEENY